MKNLVLKTFMVKNSLKSRLAKKVRGIDGFVVVIILVVLAIAIGVVVKFNLLPIFTDTIKEVGEKIKGMFA